MGGILANLRGYLLACGGNKVPATVGLTRRPCLVHLALTGEALDQLRNAHDADFGQCRKARFVHAFNVPAEPEARYLARTPELNIIRKPIPTPICRRDA